MPTEGLLDPPTFLGALRAFSRHEHQPPSSQSLLEDLSNIKRDTGTKVDLVRTPERNLIRNSGQYWKGTGLLTREPGKVELTSLGHDVASGLVTQGEFAAIMIQQTVLPNLWTYESSEIDKWREAGLEIKPLKLILEIIFAIGRGYEISKAYLTPYELNKIVVPLAGMKLSSSDIADAVTRFRSGRLDIRNYPDCTPSSNDRRFAREFLIFLSNFGLLKQVKVKPSVGQNRNGHYSDERYQLKEFFDIDVVAEQTEDSIFGNQKSADRAVSEIRKSLLPSIVDRQRTLISVLDRRGQSDFRSRIMGAYKQKCLLTGVDIPEVLEAAHIIPVKYGGSDETGNGVCLRVDIHRLFDSGNIRFKPDGSIALSSAVTNSSNYTSLPKKITYPPALNMKNVSWRDNYY